VDIAELNNEIGDIDLFLLDLILKGTVEKNMRVLDAGCGSGRNLFYFLRQGYEVKGIDKSESEVRAANFQSRSLECGDVCSVGALRSMPFPANSFDFIICSRVLHFSESKEDFTVQLAELARVLSSKGLLYLSMDAMIGMEQRVRKMDESKFQFPDGSIRFMLTQETLEEIEKSWSHEIEPRTVNFNGQHGETTLVLKGK